MKYERRSTTLNDRGTTAAKTLKLNGAGVFLNGAGVFFIRGRGIF
jgi:hypothetical protein